MPVFTQHNMLISGNVVDIVAHLDPPDLLFIQPGAYVEVPEGRLAVRKGVFKITVGSLDKDNPSTREAGRDFFNCLPITIEVFRAGATDPAATATTQSGRVPAPTPERPRSDYQTRLEVDAGPVDETRPYSRSKWIIRLTNPTDRIAQVGYQIRYIRDSSLITEDSVPLPVLNNTFGIVLNALSPKATVRGKTLTVQISPEIAEFNDSIASDGSLRFDLSDELPVGANAELMSLDVALVPGAEALLEVDKRWAEIDARLRQALLLVMGGQDHAIRAQMRANDEWRESWHEKIDPRDVAARFNVALTDIDLVLGRLWTETISAGEIADASAVIFLIFKSHLAFLPERFGQGHALVFTPAHYEGVLAEIADLIGQAPNIAEKIEEFATQALPTIHRYFAEVLLRLVHSLYEKRFIDCRIQGDQLIVRFCDDPADPGAFPRGDASSEPGTVSGERTGGGLHTRIRDLVGVSGIGGAREGMVAEPGEVEPEPLGVVPAGFQMGSQQSVARLDQVETLVVVMMENRSFDHMLGRLSRKWPQKAYICYPDEAVNLVPGHSPLKMIPARNIQIGNTYYALRVDPYHGTKHVIAQINGGKMDGFARDIMTKPEQIDRVPQLPMTYYDETDIPFFYQLAEKYLVCDRWFAAHPGGTYPNRWAFLSGTMAQINNFPPDDRRMGFLKLRTIFDFLTSSDPELNIEWVYFESNVGMLRMYDRYRLDNKRVLPYGPKGANFKALAAAGKLPPVVFIEPKITGIPPLSQASDDHPPANILRGQEFLSEVYEALFNSPQWSRSMLVITYDEHGGFYDHVPPPGTPLGDPEWVGGFPKIHPQGETFLGPRIPTFIVSPLVEPGSVSHAIFDHTSIVKTILVRHRAKFRRNIFGLFGERVPIINHLGEALNRSTAVAEIPAAPVRQERTAANYGDVAAAPVTLSNLPADVLADNDEISYGFTLARAMMPKRPPGRA